ncbi:MAG TPA: DHH family phosphoesterase [Candidatus Saccharimonadales bacterium]|nr:DHH family phosphoesterase [Candidatus Saccharimonadales bacterium]
MNNDSDVTRVKELIEAAQTIVILQADNPDADSLGSALALEQILHELGKNPLLYCAVDIPGYLKYLSGWDRISSELPQQFDATIIVDASTMTLFEKLAHSGHQGWLANKPCIILDHHASIGNEIPFMTVMLNSVDYSATGELIFDLAKKLNWSLTISAQEFIMTAILGDTQGLSNGQTTASTYRVMAAMIEAGVDRQQLEERRRELSKMPVEIFRYKARLLERTEFFANNRIAIVRVPQTEIAEYSPMYNPKLLIQYEMLQTVGVAISIVFKQYDNGRITAAVRCNPGFAIGNTLAEHFGGGGHPYAAGFKIQDGRQFDDLKTDTIRRATELLDTLNDKS